MSRTPLQLHLDRVVGLQIEAVERRSVEDDGRPEGLGEVRPDFFEGRLAVEGEVHRPEQGVLDRGHRAFRRRSLGFRPTRGLARPFLRQERPAARGDRRDPEPDRDHQTPPGESHASIPSGPDKLPLDPASLTEEAPGIPPTAGRTRPGRSLAISDLVRNRFIETRGS